MRFAVYSTVHHVKRCFFIKPMVLCVVRQNMGGFSRHIRLNLCSFNISEKYLRIADYVKFAAVCIDEQTVADIQLKFFAAER